MKKLFKDFKDSIYNPHFYREVGNRSLRSIFIYIIKVCLVVTIIALIIVVLSFLINPLQLPQAQGSVLVVGYIIAALTIPLTLLLTVFITWVLYGWVFGVLIFLVSTVLKKKIPYTISVKIALHAMSLGVALSMIPIIPYRAWLAVILPILIVFINLSEKR